jgi:MoxR-like ATPase
MSRIFGKDLESIQQSMKRRNIDISRISFTRDNFIKLTFIYLRLRVGQSVIIMGETGVGKTAIINYLADVLDYDFRVLNLHEGI